MTILPNTVTVPGHTLADDVTERCSQACNGTWPGGRPFHVKGCPNQPERIDTWLCFDALGTPVTQGSIRSLGAGRPSVHGNAARLKPWRMAVQWAAQDAMRLHDRFDGPVEVRLLFCFDRPRGHYRAGRNAELLRDDAPPFPATRATGDGDKLVRACFDAMEAGGLVRDDAQFVRHSAVKVWCGEHEDALDVPGVRVRVRAVTR